MGMTGLKALRPARDPDLRATERMRSAGRVAAAFCVAGGLAAAVAGEPARAYTKSSITIDARSGLVLQAHNADASHPPASLSKLMTLYLTFEAMSRGRFGWNTRVRVSRYAARRQPSKLYLRTGQRVRVRDLVYATAIKSANDAAAALAEKIAGSERRFARLMTKRARQLGMRRTVFGTASGLPARGQRTTARDMAILARSLVHHYPQYAKVFSTRYYRFGRRSFRNTNRLLRSHPHVRGMKTGYTRRARYNLVTNARNGNIHLITVVLGARTSNHRYWKTKRLLASGWRTAHNSAYLRKRPRGYVRIAMRSSVGGKPTVKTAGKSRTGKTGAAPQKGSRKQVAALPKKRPDKPRVGLSLTSSAVAAPRPAAAQRPARRPARSETVRRRKIHGVQVGAFYSRHQAKSAIRRAMRALPRSYRRLANGAIVRSRGRKRTIYIARLMGFGLRQAQRACQTVQRRGIDCVPVSVRRKVAKPTPETVTVRRSKSKSRFGIQVGAFTEYRRAQRGLTQARKVLPNRLARGTGAHIQARRNRSNRPIYRARITGLSFSQAREACTILKRRSLNCMAIKISARG